MIRHGDIGSRHLAEYLRERAVEEAAEGEFHPGEHTFWIAADRIEDFLSMLQGEDDVSLLMMLADRCQERENKRQVEIESQLC